MKTIIELMCDITEKMRKPESHELAMTNMDNAAEEIDALSKMLKLNANQTVFLTVIVGQSSRYELDASRIACELDIDYIKFLSYDDDLQALRKAGYIRIDEDGNIRVPKQVLSKLKSNEPYAPDPIEGLGTMEILGRINGILEMRRDNYFTTEEALAEIHVLLDTNPATSISTACKAYMDCVCSVEQMFFFVLLDAFYFEDDDMVSWHDVRDYLSKDELSRLRAMYKRENGRLQRTKVVKYNGSNGFLSRDSFCISEQSKNEILADEGGFQNKKKEGAVSGSRKLKAGDISEKELFYNPTEERQVRQLKDLMGEARFADIRAKLKEKNLRTGFTCLFYGGPGTGKTETVYQIARESGRDLFIVDVSQIKSCWVGESEKNIKEVFDNYRERVKKDARTPILLFNEADAVFGIRNEGAGRAVDKMENSIQNIILQEMEDLDGILIATTNLTCNLDKAFERRFLYKIRFEKPSLDAKSHIWRTMIPELSEEEALRLAGMYDFSGGQIENISRKREVNALINGVEPGFEQIVEYCEEECIDESGPRPKIGFAC
ncbi:MAG: AAA family ATPase [Bacteroidales bacterium]|nr:AAA family ATPase [Bacteroidales bacterium]